MAKTEEDVAQNLTSTNNQIIATLVQEYEYQISKWKNPMESIFDAYNTALGNVNGVIGAVKSKQKAADDLILGAITLAAGAAVGWLAPIARKHLTSKYPNFQGSFVVGEYSLINGNWGAVYKVENEGTARAKYFGATIEPGVSAVSGVVKALFGTESKGENPAFTGLGTSSYGSFKSNLTSVFNEEITLAKGIFGKMTHKTIDGSFGHKLIRELKKTPGYSSRTSMDNLEEAGKIRMYTDYDKIRNEWAKSWFYFGNNPPPKGHKRWASLSTEMEIALWSVWIQQQDFKVKSMPGMGHLKYILGRDQVPPAHPIMARLVNDLYQTPLIDLEHRSHNPWSASPVVGVLANDSIEPRDIPTLNNWAVKRPSPEALGKSLFKKREIGTLRDDTSIFK